jgi:hypothetical protein
MVLVGKEGRVECGIRGRLRVGKRGKGLRMGCLPLFPTLKPSSFSHIYPFILPLF